MKVLGKLMSLALCTSTLANDGFEFYGGRKKRRTHGLNSVTQTKSRRNPHGEDDKPLRWDQATTMASEIHMSRDEAPPAPKIGLGRNTRRLLKGREEQLLMLPDRYSVLDFTNEEEKELTAESSWWGRLFVQGFPGPIQYFRAHFGSVPPNGEVKLLLASPVTMCDDMLVVLDNESKVDSSTVIVAQRGPECTFGDKAILAHELGAIGVVFINNEPGNSHPAAPNAHDLSLSATMIAQDDGIQLLRALTRVQDANDPGFSLRARYVPFMCGDERAAVTNSHSYCHPVQQNDKEFVKSLDYKGKMSTKGLTFDYIQGEFGSWIDPTIDWITVIPTVIGGDPRCCDPSGFVGNELSPNNAVLCERGECDFATKAENVDITGAGLLIVSSHNATMYRMGVDPPIRGRKVTVATSMVDLESYEHMLDYDGYSSSSLALLQPSFNGDSCDESEAHKTLGFQA